MAKKKSPKKPKTSDKRARRPAARRTRAVGKRKPVAWLTYAWVDNADHNVEFVAQELLDAGITVRLDRWTLTAGKSLWKQIGSHITSPQTDGWLLYATEHSLASEACAEEYDYALNRAIRTRGREFPIIGLFPGNVDEELIPPGIQARLYVRLTGQDWKEQVVAAMEGRDIRLSAPRLAPYQLTCHRLQWEHKRCAIEVRPRIDEWTPALFAIPIEEEERVKPSLSFGPRGTVPNLSMLFGASEGPSADDKWWILTTVGMSATPATSLYVTCEECPSRFVFGQRGSVLHEAVCPPEFSGIGGSTK
jgi:TIR domain-containing protein